jgi:hypothetical protein
MASRGGGGAAQGIRGGWVWVGGVCVCVLGGGGCTIVGFCLLPACPDAGQAHSPQSAKPASGEDASSSPCDARLGAAPAQSSPQPSQPSPAPELAALRGLRHDVRSTHQHDSRCGRAHEARALPGLQVGAGGRRGCALWTPARHSNAPIHRSHLTPATPRASAARSKPMRTCLCDAIPKPKRPLQGHLIVLMHPQEIK